MRTCIAHLVNYLYNYYLFLFALSDSFNSWIDEQKDFKVISNFFKLSYILEEKFLEYLEYVPLRKKYLDVTSDRLSGFIYEIFPLMTRGFDSLTFGQIMKDFVKRNASFQFSKEGSNILIEFNNSIKELYKKRKKNRIELKDYYNFHFNNQSKIVFWPYSCFHDYKLTVRNIVGKLEYYEEIYPFKKNEFKNLRDTRNKIVKRRETECSIKDVLHGMACLSAIRERITYGYYRRDMNVLNRGSLLFNIEKSLKMH